MYVVASFVLLGVMMFVLADRLTEPSTRFEPATSTIEPANEFVPADRSVSECISAIPKPGCGSEARGGWRQTLIFAAILAGLALIAWRVVIGARRAQLSRAPVGTSAPDALDDDRAP